MDWNEVKDFPKDDMILLQLASFVFKGQALFEAYRGREVSLDAPGFRHYMPLDISE